MSAPSNLTDQERRLWEAEARMTPGPWEVFGLDIVATSLDASGERIDVLHVFDPSDATGIALARNAVRPLLEEIARLREAIKQEIANCPTCAWLKEHNPPGRDQFCDTHEKLSEVLEERKP